MRLCSKIHPELSDPWLEEGLQYDIAPLELGQKIRWIHPEMIPQYFTRSDCASFALHTAMTIDMKRARMRHATTFTGLPALY